jgi:hypothetical protein
MTTKTNIALAELAEKGADSDLLRDMIQYVAQRMMELDTEGPEVTRAERPATFQRAAESLDRH